MSRRSPEPAIAVSVVIPAHNSGALIGETVAALAQRLAPIHAEIIVVENGSTDDTQARCARLLAEWDHPKVDLVCLESDRGMGNALRVGIMHSRGASLLLTADDLPFGFDDLDGAEALRSHGDVDVPLVVIGSKAHPRSRVRRGWARDLATRGFSIARRVLIGMKTGDPQGTFIVDGPFLRSIMGHLSEPGYLFTTELAYVAERLGHLPVEVPVALRDNHGGHSSRVSLSDAAAMAAGLLALRLRHRGRHVIQGAAGRDVRG